MHIPHHALHGDMTAIDPDATDLLDLLDALVLAETEVWNHLHAELLHAGLEPMRSAHTLRVVARLDGSARVDDLSRALAITIGAASKLVDRLEEAGLVARRANPDDRRSSLVSLTDRGARAMLDATGAIASALAPWRERLAIPPATLAAELRRLRPQAPAEASVAEASSAGGAR